MVLTGSGTKMVTMYSMPAANAQEEGIVTNGGRVLGVTDKRERT